MNQPTQSAPVTHETSAPHGRRLDVSVIIPTCDRPTTFLLEAVQSVLDQSHAPAEVIIIDNGANAVLKQDLPTSVRLTRIRPYSGASAARNIGAALARSRFIAFLDDDDWWDTAFLACALRCTQGNGARIVYGRIDNIYEGRLISSTCLRPDYDWVEDILLRNRGTSGNNLLIERDFFWRIGGFRQSLRTSEDRALAIDAILAGEKIGVAPDAVTYARHHRGARLRISLWARMIFFLIYREQFTTRSTITYAWIMLKVLWNRIFGRGRKVLSSIKRAVLRREQLRE